MTTFTRSILPFAIKATPDSTSSDFAVSTDGSVELTIAASFAAAVTTVPPKSIVITDPATGIHYKIPVYVSGA